MSLNHIPKLVRCTCCFNVRLTCATSTWLQRSSGAFVVGLMLLGVSSTAQAQLFGERRVGSPLSAQAGGTGQNPGNLTGSERFLRGNRSRRDFVGSDRSEADGFVGASQAIGVGRVPAATESLRIDNSDTRLNRPVPPLAAKGMYYPRLELDSASVLPSASPPAPPATNRLRQQIQQVAGAGAVVQVQGRTAVLTGTVATPQAAELAAILASFEPGIDQVRNALQVSPTASSKQ